MNQPIEGPVSATKQKKDLSKSLNPFVLMFFIIAIMTALTYIVPAGQYDRVEVEGRSVVDPETFRYIDQQPIGFLEMFNSVHVGFVEGGMIILFVFLFGGALGIMQRTGAIDALIKVTAARFASREYVLVPILTLMFALLGALIGSAEDQLVYIAIIAPMLLALKLDTLTAYASVALGMMSVGFVSGITNPFNIGVAQTIAELPVYSGMGLRIALFAVFYIMVVGYIFLHMKKIKKDPSRMVYGKYNPEEIPEVNKSYKASASHKLSMVILGLTFAGLVYGVINLGWYISEIAGIFLLGGIVMAIICRIAPGEMADGFIEGAKEMTSGALIIGVATTILVIAREGALLDTILHAAAGLLGTLPASLNAVGMFITQLFINFLVPSGSGQAALTMPVMAPLADLLGVTRQTAVLAFQLGDGLSNIVIPTSGVTLAGLAMMGIPFTKWVKWVFPLFVAQVVVGAIFLLIAQAIGYGPF
ncbi:YfcC family protein [Bhargavaea massiliensis]|uniref:YfcC family protein n=1 Tax=Bhargavaea massiliensis TaxID=2697500 RepID=UPI001BCD5510|nr:AbgT family transporter [Bhargavaea massiliensis]